MKKIFVIVLCFICNAVFSQHVEIKGVAKEYAGQELQFYIYDDYLTKTAKNVGLCAVSDAGEFSCTLKIPSTCQIYVNLGVNKGTFYAERGKEYELVLPPYQPIELVHELNPYFESNELMLGIKNVDTLGLNYTIFSFDDDYNTFIDNRFGYLYLYADRSVVDSLEKHYDTVFSHVDSGSFSSDYIHYRLAILKHMVYERDLMYAVKNYLLNKEILYHNPSYMHLFTQLFQGYFTKDYLLEYGARIVDAVKYYKSPTILKNVLDEKIAFRNDTLKELIILQGLMDAYTMPEVFPRNTVDMTLDSLLLLTQNPEHKRIGENIKKMQKKLVPGDFAPPFELEDKYGNKVTLSDFKNSYVYLMFCRCESYTCQEDYKLISSLYEEQLPDLAIVTVGFESDKSIFQDFLAKNSGYNWHFLYAGKNNPVKTVYQIRAFPSYFLIDPDGRIALLPAPSPHENFKWYFRQTIYWREQAKRFDNARQEKLGDE